MIFSDSPQQRALERMMTAVPRFLPQGGGIMVLHRFAYTAEMCDCRYCPYYRGKRKCTADGLAQWTVESRKAPLLAFANARGCSIGDLDMQLDFLLDELETKFPSVLSTLKNAKSVREASNAVLFNFEAPLDQSESVQAQRAANGSVYYSRYGQ